MTGTKRRKIETTKIVMTIGNVKSDLMSTCKFPPSNRQADFSTKMSGFAVLPFYQALWKLRERPGC